MDDTFRQFFFISVKLYDAFLKWQTVILGYSIVNKSLFIIHNFRFKILFHNQNPREASSRRQYSYVHLYICVFVYVFMCVTSPGHTNKDTDLKFGTHTPIDLI